MRSRRYTGGVGSPLKPTRLDVPLGPERRQALALVTDRWALWTILAVHETEGARFNDLAAEPGLSRRVLAERLRTLVEADLLRTERYSTRPPRNRYLLTDRGAQVRRLALATVHVAAGGFLAADPFAAGGSSETRRSAVAASEEQAADAHPADALLAGDLDAARRIHDETIAPLARYDSQYRTSLVETLETWLACDASVSVAAARLYAHRHTVRYRLDRVRELTGLDVSNSDHRERIALGLRARRILTAADPEFWPAGQ